ncbi:glutaredoxin family protein [Thaumasiovibrio subtropicus]|uniref:glutaredoxin family protein n=1 Tax=Thaumasiovibrio subtropicus TaxID=1891207 RepID=UPI000B34B8A1|nr:glutathione S-transferase N-terminal domain-containing protein [Thaumasiovibrio subtropicus]
MKLIRWILGRLILGISTLTKPSGITRSEADQQSIDNATTSLSLYQFPACPFCVKVRRSMARLSLNIETRDPRTNAEDRQALLEGGGKLTVPCLRIEEAGQVTWMYESSDIVAYLEQRFGQQTA